MKYLVYDTEVFKHDWIFIAKDIETGQYDIFHNDAYALQHYFSNENVYIGFNTKDYDQFIVKAICGGCTMEEIKFINDSIISGHRGWDNPLLKDIRFRFNNADIRDDMQQGLSLKAIECHLGMDIEETEVDFNLDRPLNPEELALTIKYCKHDVDATEQIIKLRKNYLQTKIDLGAEINIDKIKALSMTNAKLTALYLGARKPSVPYTDEREYTYPSNLLTKYIPQEVFQFFDKLKDYSIADKDVFSSKLEIMVGATPVTLGYGGIHGAIKHKTYENTLTRIIRNYDVASYYPHLMVLCGYLSRNIENPQTYKDMLKRRIQAKKDKNKSLANALKLVANTTYGGTLNEYNELFDPLMARSVCISGQLFLLELSFHLLEQVPELLIIQLNTDGIMVQFEPQYNSKVQEILQEWQTRTGFELEEDCIKRIIQKDVNNYIEIAEDDSTKCKGGVVTYGIAKAGAFNINNNFTIVKKAIVEYFVNGIPIEETINNCNDILEFQMVAKAGGTYQKCFHYVNGKFVEVQKCNRVYATVNISYGSVYKCKQLGSYEKIAELPMNCIVDNKNTITIQEIDKDWYIRLAIKKAREFQGITYKSKQANKIIKDLLNILN